MDMCESERWGGGGGEREGGNKVGAFSKEGWRGEYDSFQKSIFVILIKNVIKRIRFSVRFGCSRAMTPTTATINSQLLITCLVPQSVCVCVSLCICKRCHHSVSFIIFFSQSHSFPGRHCLLSRSNKQEDGKRKRFCTLFFPYICRCYKCTPFCRLHLNKLHNADLLRGQTEYYSILQITNKKYGNAMAVVVYKFTICA